MFSVRALEAACIIDVVTSDFVKPSVIHTVFHKIRVMQTFQTVQAFLLRMAGFMFENCVGNLT